MNRAVAITLPSLLVAALLLLIPASQASSVRVAHLETGTFSEITPNTDLGEVRVSTEHAYDGRRSFSATYCGRGDVGYARGQYAVHWPDGADVWYGVALLLPHGFYDAMAGQVDLLRWDNFNLHGQGADYGGVVIYGSDHRARLLRGTYGHDDSSQLGRAFRIPEGRWVWLEVHQRLGDGAGARSTVFLDGRQVASSSRADSFGRLVTRIRYGIVAIDAGRQVAPVTVWMDRATAGTQRVGPLGPRARRAVMLPHHHRHGGRTRLGSRCPR